MIASFAVVEIYPILVKKFNDLVPIFIFAIISLFGIPFGAILIPKQVDDHEDNLTLI